MEMMRPGQYIGKGLCLLLRAFVLTAICLAVDAQPPVKLYTIKNGKMYIQLSRDVKETSLDSFITQYSLQDLALKRFLVSGFDDSLIKYGWEIMIDDAATCVITKPMVSIETSDNPADRIRYADKSGAFDAEFPSVSQNIVYGVNRFRNKYPFATHDSVITFFLRKHLEARKVSLAGSFNNWEPNDIWMKRTDSGWIAQVKLSPGKYWYKFIIDAGWNIDEDNRLNENDGRGNTNSIFYVTNTRFKLDGFTGAKNVYLSGSFNNWEEKQLAMTKTATGWELPLYLADGTHTYRFIVDGKWYSDPTNNDRLPNEFEEYNSVLRIGKPSIFRLNGYKEAKQVILTGSFNKWRKDELYMKKSNNGWELEYTLGPGNYEYRVIVDGKEMTDNQQLLTVNNEQHEKSLLVLNANYTFRLEGHSKARKVFLAGDFNDWNPSTMPMQKEGTEWVFRVHLSPGKHLYKFIVDGKWIIDPGNKTWEENEYGTGNSVLWIGQ